MKISIAMATYNGARFLRAQLQSFLDQSHKPDELIITDDCSNDETEIIVREFCKSAPFKVEYFRNESNLGYCGNFNAALMKTTGDLVFLSDQDDVWFPEKIEYMLQVAKQHPQALIVMNDAVLTDEELNEVGFTKLEQMRSAGYSLDDFVMGCCCGVRRELLNISMPISIGFKGHDNWLVWFAAGLNAKLVVDKALQYYRRHESNESQFIANRTTKITRTGAYVHAFQNAVRQDSEPQFRTLLSQFEIFADGVCQARATAPEIYRDQLERLEKRYRTEIDVMYKRAAIRKKWLVPRIVAIGVLFLQGGYNASRRLRSVMRDVIG